MLKLLQDNEKGLEMKRYSYACWGEWMPQTIAGNGKDFYIQGYTPSGKIEKIKFTARELDDLIVEALKLKRRLG